MVTKNVSLVNLRENTGPGQFPTVDTLGERECQLLRHALLVEVVSSSKEIEQRTNAEASLLSLSVKGIPEPLPGSLFVVDYRKELFSVLHGLDGGEIHTDGTSALVIGTQQLRITTLGALRHAIIRCQADPGALRSLAGLPPAPPSYQREILKDITQFLNKAIDLSPA